MPGGQAVGKTAGVLTVDKVDTAPFGKRSIELLYKRARGGRLGDRAIYQGGYPHALRYLTSAKTASVRVFRSTPITSKLFGLYGSSRTALDDRGPT